MANRSRKFTIAGTTASMITWTDDTGNVGDSLILLENIDGWDELPEISRNVAPRNFGHGEFQSNNATFGPRIVAITCSASYPTEVDIRALRTNIRFLAADLNNFLVLTMTYYKDGVETFRETLQARPEVDFLEEWAQMENDVTFTLVFRASNPFKTVYLNGSATPEEAGRL